MNAMTPLLEMEGVHKRFVLHLQSQTVLDVLRDFSLRADIITTPLLTASGSTAVPSTVDVYVGSVRTPTLVVHSGQDLRCPVGQGEALYLALQRVGVPTEFVRVPTESHERSRAGRPWHRVFRLDRYLDWFARWL